MNVKKKENDYPEQREKEKDGSPPEMARRVTKYVDQFHPVPLNSKASTRLPEPSHRVCPRNLEGNSRSEAMLILDSSPFFPCNAAMYTAVLQCSPEGRRYSRSTLGSFEISQNITCFALGNHLCSSIYLTRDWWNTNTLETLP